MEVNVEHLFKSNEWGWQLTAGKFEPRPTDQEPAPQELLKIISCSCKPSARSHSDTNRCTCRNNGLTCIAACGNCYGADCLNVAAAVLCDSDGDDFSSGNVVDDTGEIYLTDDLDYAEEVEVS